MHSLSILPETSLKVVSPMPESVYRQRDPQNSPYYQCVEDHFETFEQVYKERFERRYGFFRPYVKHQINEES